jgi:hypothetical protein
MFCVNFVLSRIGMQLLFSNWNWEICFRGRHGDQKPRYMCDFCLEQIRIHGYTHTLAFSKTYISYKLEQLLYESRYSVCVAILQSSEPFLLAFVCREVICGYCSLFMD